MWSAVRVVSTVMLVCAKMGQGRRNNTIRLRTHVRSLVSGAKIDRKKDFRFIGSPSKPAEAQ